ncbi:hypothetical protein At12D13_01020 [Agrobacterium fabrum]|nr:hypothetical protein At12D13_01020 [Agrobacterium fabrum]
MRLLTPRSPEIEGHSRGRTAPNVLPYGGPFPMRSNTLSVRATGRRQLHQRTCSVSFMRTTLRACILAAGLLVTPSGLYAACGFEGIPEQYRPYDLSESATNIMGRPVIGGEAASTRAVRECHEQQSRQLWYQTLGFATDANTETLYQGVADSFKAGGSIALNLLASYRRAYDNPVDPDFDPLRWLDDNREKYRIELRHLSSFAGTGSNAEALALLVDVTERKAAEKRIQRMGAAAQLTARAIAALPDVALLLVIVAALCIPLRAAFRRTGRSVSAMANT